jgi:hypothetical protein
MAMTSVSVMMTVFVLNLHYRGPKKNEIPFWLQQLLSLSLANIVQTVSKSKRSKMLFKIKKPTQNRKSSHDINEHRNIPNHPSANGLLLSYTNINETKNRIRATTDVSKS